MLYINDSRRSYIRAFDLLPNGTLAKQTDRVFVDLRGEEPGVPDGMKVDVEGNVYCGGAGGLWIMDPHGKKLGRIVHGAAATTILPLAAMTGKPCTSPAGTSGLRQREDSRHTSTSPAKIAIIAFSGTSLAITLGALSPGRSSPSVAQDKGTRIKSVKVSALGYT